MSWYAANLLFESMHSTEPASGDLWEESVVLVEAENAALARDIANEVGTSRELSYAAQGVDVVTWRFRKVDRIYEIQSRALDSGIEVFSRYLRPSEVESLLTPFRESE